VCVLGVGCWVGVGGWGVGVGWGRVREGRWRRGGACGRAGVTPSGSPAQPRVTPVSTANPQTMIGAPPASQPPRTPPPPTPDSASKTPSACTVAEAMHQWCSAHLLIGEAADGAPWSHVLLTRLPPIQQGAPLLRCHAFDRRQRAQRVAHCCGVWLCDACCCLRCLICQV